MSDAGYSGKGVIIMRLYPPFPGKNSPHSFPGIPGNNLEKIIERILKKSSGISSQQRPFKPDCSLSLSLLARTMHSRERESGSLQQQCMRGEECDCDSFFRGARRASQTRASILTRQWFSTRLVNQLPRQFARGEN